MHFFLIHGRVDFEAVVGFLSCPKNLWWCAVYHVWRYRCFNPRLAFQIEFKKGLQGDPSPGEPELGWLALWLFHSDRKIGLMKQQGLCHPKCSKWEQNKQSDWSDFIGWSKQAIWLVQLLSLWRGFEKYFRLRVTKVPFLKSWWWLISFISGWGRDRLKGRVSCIRDL